MSSEYVQKRAAAKKEFMSKNDVSAKDMDMIDHMADVTSVIGRFTHLFTRIPNHMKKEMAKTLFGIKEKMDEFFPNTVGDNSIMDECVICFMDDDTKEGEEKEKCPHGEAMRAGLLLMALFRIYPEYDMDADEEEDAVPGDLNEDMVPV
jgi:hypothetical protein